ncbi:MAG: glycosyltransferase, partial [Methanobacterium paludis]|nr:glycosyltransferase [Methanobacterium paludis]
MKYKISIIIPVFNVEDYIKDALKSIIKQTIGVDHLEVIMVDDCSTDKSGKIIDEYANKYKNFKAMHLPKNSGAAGTPRNVGIEKATGDYLMFLDPDDYYADDACEILYNKIFKEDADIAFTRYIYVFKDNLQKSYSSFGNINEIKIKTINEDPRLLTIPPSVWTKIYKRSFIIDNNLRFLEGIYAEDLVFTLNTFLEANGIIYLNNHFSYYYRIRDTIEDSSISRDKNKKNLMGLIKGYYKAYDILRYYKKGDYFPTIFMGHLQFWADAFILSDIT